jgi:hypothetical protein
MSDLKKYVAERKVRLTLSRFGDYFLEYMLLSGGFWPI